MSKMIFKLLQSCPALSGTTLKLRTAWMKSCIHKDEPRRHYAKWNDARQRGANDRWYHLLETNHIPWPNRRGDGQGKEFQSQEISPTDLWWHDPIVTNALICPWYFLKRVELVKCSHDGSNSSTQSRWSSCRLMNRSTAYISKGFVVVYVP